MENPVSPSRQAYVSSFHSKERREVSFRQQQCEETFCKGSRIITLCNLRETYDPQVITPIAIFCVFCPGLQCLDLDFKGMEITCMVSNGVLRCKNPLLHLHPAVAGGETETSV